MKAAAIRLAPVPTPSPRKRRAKCADDSCTCACHGRVPLHEISARVGSREIDLLGFPEYYVPLPGAPNPLWRAFFRAVATIFRRRK